MDKFRFPRSILGYAEVDSLLEITLLNIEQNRGDFPEEVEDQEEEIVNDDHLGTGD